jgi:hypothetical protein
MKRRDRLDVSLPEFKNYWNLSRVTDNEALKHLPPPDYFLGGEPYWTEATFREITSYIPVLRNPIEKARSDEDFQHLMQKISSPMEGDKT